jgi:hypothetical protein
LSALQLAVVVLVAVLAAAETTRAVVLGTSRTTALTIAAVLVHATVALGVTTTSRVTRGHKIVAVLVLAAVDYAVTNRVLRIASLAAWRRCSGVNTLAATKSAIN